MNINVSWDKNFEVLMLYLKLKENKELTIDIINAAQDYGLFLKKVFDSVTDAARYVGISKVFVSRVARGQCKQSHGWVFEFIN